jgi:hypothetical protein
MSRSTNPLIRKLDDLYSLNAEEKSVLESAFSRIKHFTADEDLVQDGHKFGECWIPVPLPPPESLISICNCCRIFQDQRPIYNPIYKLPHAS